jgi:hypothetical protein
MKVFINKEQKEETGLLIKALNMLSKSPNKYYNLYVCFDLNEEELNALNNIKGIRDKRLKFPCDTSEKYGQNILISNLIDRSKAEKKDGSVFIRAKDNFRLVEIEEQINKIAKDFKDSLMVDKFSKTDLSGNSETEI